MKIRSVAFLGLATAVAMVLSFLESLVPPLVAIPGIKIGLPNVVIMFLLYAKGSRTAATVSLVRVFLVALLFGNIQSLVFSASGAAVSLIGMIFLKKTKLFSYVTVSVTGGVLHNLGQTLAAILWTGTAQIAYYLPVLLVSGTVAGVAIGLMAGILIKRKDMFLKI